MRKSTLIWAVAAGAAAWLIGSGGRRRSRRAASPPSDPRVIPQQALDLIKKWEGFRPEAYLDPVGVPTIGYGTTYYPDGTKVKLGDTVDEATAESYLRHYLERKALPKLEGIPNWANMTAGQRSALYSFAYNVGPNFYPGKPSITAALRSKDWILLVPDALMLYVKAGGKTLQGLVNRRQDEVKTWWS